MTEEKLNILKGMQQELRRGAVVLCVLSRLKSPQYGYALVERLDKSGFSVDPGTLYPLLRRLEGQGLLNSEWETSGPKPRKNYVMNENGKNLYAMLKKDWEEMQFTINSMISEGE